MKPILKAVAVFAILGAGLASAQQNLNGKVQHAIVVIQENRTPDNLFQQDQTLINNGAHILPYGFCDSTKITLQSAPLTTCWDTDHSHGYVAGISWGAWTTMWDKGAMDGACRIHVSSGSCVLSPCTDTNYGYCPSMTYVENSIWDLATPHRILDPYFQIANQYGFANWMFQTNQGPSFPAHQFLFSGTSAPVPYSDPNNNCTSWSNDLCWQWFDAENVSKPEYQPGKLVNSGCIADEYDYEGTEYYSFAYLINPSSQESLEYLPTIPVASDGFPCYNHKTLVDVLPPPQPAIPAWKYYARRPGDLWTAPTAFAGICQPSAPGGTCQGTAYTSSNPNVVLPVKNGDQAPILADIQNCALAPVNWVVPDGNWSDHNGFLPGDGGPSWVAAIVNAVGTDPGGCGYWPNTVILITWDDWGGLYDDVVPPDCPDPSAAPDTRRAAPRMASNTCTASACRCWWCQHGTR